MANGYRTKVGVQNNGLHGLLLLSASEAAAHPHNRARGTFVEIDGVMQPAPAPRFSRTQSDLPDPPQPMTEENSLAALKQWLDPVKAEAWLAASKG